MRPHGPLEGRDVERFYARQRAEILDRTRRAPAVPSAGRRAWASIGGPVTIPLAAAAVLALAALGLFLLHPPPTGEGPPSLGGGLLDAGTASLPLAAYGSWSEEETPEAGEDFPRVGSLGWLLDEASYRADEPVPDYLEPFGSWPDEPGATTEKSET